METRQVIPIAPQGRFLLSTPALNPTRIELASRIRDYQKSPGATKLGKALWLVLLILPPAFLFLFDRSSGAAHEARVVLMMWIWIIVMIAGGSVLGIRLRKRSREKHKAFCPACETDFTGIHGKVAIATCFCGACGESVAREDDDLNHSRLDSSDTPDKSSMLTGAELSTRTLRAEQWKTGMRLIYTLLALGLCLPFLLLIDSRLGVPALALWLLCGLLPGYRHSAMLKREGLTCPHCEGHLSGVNRLLVLHTGFCGCCGHRIISDPEPPVPKESSYSRHARDLVSSLPLGNPTRAELATRIRLYENASKRIKLREPLAVAIAILPAVAFMVAFPKLPDAWYILLIVWVFTWLIVASTRSGKKLKHLNRDSGLHCPHCAKLLTGQLGSLAVGTLLCHSCGNQVASGDEPHESAQP